MRRSTRLACCVAPMLLLAAGRGGAQPPLSADDVTRVREAVGQAFGFLYAMPPDTAAAAMGTWVLDSNATTSPADGRGQWRIVATKLTDTGDELNVEEMTGKFGSSPRELAAAMSEMQQLEARISRAEAEASLDVRVTLNGAGLNEPVGLRANPGQMVDGIVKASRESWLRRGYWNKVVDHELALTVDRWVAGEVYVRYTSTEPRAVQSITIRARGNDMMLDRLVREACWEMLAALVQ